MRFSTKGVPVRYSQNALHICFLHPLISGTSSISTLLQKRVEILLGNLRCFDVNMQSCMLFYHDAYWPTVIGRLSRLIRSYTSMRSWIIYTFRTSSTLLEVPIGKPSLVGRQTTCETFSTFCSIITRRGRSCISL